MAFGKYAVDFEERVNFQRLREERLEKAKEQLSRDGLGGRCNLGSRYDSIHLVSLYHHALEGGPNPLCILPRNGDPVIFIAGTVDVRRKQMP